MSCILYDLHIEREYVAMDWNILSLCRVCEWSEDCCKKKKITTKSLGATLNPQV